NAHLLSKLGAHVALAGPRTLLPFGLEKQITPSEGSVTFAPDINEAIKDADVVMMLRIQFERQSGGFFPSLGEDSIHYGWNRRRLELAKDDVIVLHPGPINRGIEIDSDVADGPFSLILNQVENGVAVRMAVLYLLAGGEKEHRAPKLKPPKWGWRKGMRKRKGFIVGEGGKCFIRAKRL